MTNQIDALKLALEALENGMKFVWTDPEREAGFVAIDAIKAALAQPASMGHRDGHWCVDLTCKKCYSADFRLKHTTPPAAQPEERNFCPRCGKRTADLTVIHTCTPPQEKNT